MSFYKLEKPVVSHFLAIALLPQNIIVVKIITRRNLLSFFNSLLWRIKIYREIYTIIFHSLTWYCNHTKTNFFCSIAKLTLRRDFLALFKSVANYIKTFLFIFESFFRIIGNGDCRTRSSYSACGGIIRINPTSANITTCSCAATCSCNSNGFIRCISFSCGCGPTVFPTINTINISRYISCGCSATI